MGDTTASISNASADTYDPSLFLASALTSFSGPDGPLSCCKSKVDET